MTSHTNPSQLDVLLEILGVLNVAAGQPNRLTWNDEDGTLDLALAGGNVTLQLGQEEVQYSYNDGGTTIVDGNVVYTSGAQGNRIAVRKAQANLSSTSKGTIGIATESILNGGIGFITTRGLVRDIKTDVDSEGHSLVEGDRLYLSATVLGGFSKTPPVAANAQHVFVGYVIRAHATVGSIFVQTVVATDITELQGANISTTPADRSLIQYDSSLGVWKNVTGLISGNNLIHGNGENEGMLVGTGGTRTWSFADLKGHYISNTSGVNAPTLETFAPGILRLGFNLSDVAISELHLEHNELIGGVKFIHPHIMMAAGATATGPNLVLTHVVLHSYASIGAGETRGLSPAPTTITQTITPAELNAIGSRNSRPFDIEFANSGGTGGKLNSLNMLPDDLIIINTTITSLPAITGGSSSKVAILPVDVHREVTDGSGTLHMSRVATGSFFGTNT